MKNTPTAWLTDPSLRRFALLTERNHTDTGAPPMSARRNYVGNAPSRAMAAANYPRSSGCTMYRNEWPLNRLTSSVP